MDYGDRLLSKISESLELDQICDRELISVNHQCDESCDIEITASVVLILKEVYNSDIDRGAKLSATEKSAIETESCEEEIIRTDESTHNNIVEDNTDGNQNTAKGTPLQLWRYVNGGPMLDYDDAYACSFSNAIRSLNWAAFGHALKRSDTEGGMPESIVHRTPSWILSSKRDDGETFVYKTVSATVGECDIIQTTSFCNEAQVRSNKNKYTADDNHYGLHDNPVTNRKRQKVRVGKTFSDDAIAFRRCETVKRRQVEPCQMIVFLDAKMSSGKEKVTCHETGIHVVASDVFILILVVPYANLNKTVISKGSRAFQTTLQKGTAYRHDAAQLF